jgi:Na+/proline symporter
MNIAYAGIIAIIIYSIIVIAIALGVGYSKATVSTSRGFFIGTGTKLFVLIFCTAAAGYSTWVFQGAPASVYENGTAWFTCAAIWLLTIAYFPGYFGPRFWRLSQEYGYVTPADLVDGYYKSKGNILRYIIALIHVVFIVPSLVAQIKGMGLAVETITLGKIPFTIGACYCAALVGFYCFRGGFRSQAWVDTAQGLLFVGVAWASAILVLSRPEVGGLTGMYNALEAYNQKLLLFAKEPEYWNVRMAVSFSLMQLFGGMVQPMFWQRYYAAESGKTLVKMGRLLAFLFIIGVIFPVSLVGIGGNLFDLNYTSPQNVFQTVISYISPFWGIMVTIAILAAGMSTVAGNLITCSSVLSVDLVKQFKKNATDEYILKTGRFFTALLAIISFILSLKAPTSITWLLQISLAGFALVLIPVIGIFWWKRGTVWGVISGMLVGLVVSVIFTFFIPNYLSFAGGAWGWAAGFAVFIIVSLFTKPISDEERAAYMRPLVETKVREATKVL